MENTPVYVDFLSFDLNQLKSLNPATPPLWGRMNLHQMIEHLILTLTISRTNTVAPHDYQHEAFERGRAFLNGPKPLPKNYRAEYWPEITVPSSKDVSEAVDRLIQIRADFWQDFEENPTKLIFHPNFGMLDKSLVYALQNKHFTHHFQQFSIV